MDCPDCSIEPEFIREQKLKKERILTQQESTGGLCRKCRKFKQVYFHTNMYNGSYLCTDCLSVKT